MKKLLSLLSVLGLMAFVTLPIYAQEVNSDEERNDFEEWVDFEDNYNEATVEEYDYNEPVVENVDDQEGYRDYEEPEYSYNYGVNEDEYALESAEQEISAALNNLDLNNLSEEELAGIMVLLGSFGLFIVIRGYCCYVFAALQPISKWEIYRKAGKKGWAFLIPFWGTMVYSEIAGMNKWIGLLPWIAGIFGFFVGSIPGKVYGIIMFILVLASLIWWIAATYRIARKYGWGVFASILHVLFNPITTLILGLGNYKYEGKSGENDA